METKNSCGECTACCRSVAVPSIGKPAGVLCTHCEIGVGCKIYERKPGACTGYECWWLRTNSPEPGMRPDRAGFILEITVSKLLGEYIGVTLILLEVEEGSLERETARAFTQEALVDGRFVAHLTLLGKVKLFLPKHVILTESAMAMVAEEGFEIVLAPQ